MRISWFFGFGWLAIVILIASGIGINLSDGWLRWGLYVPFMIAGVYMTVRFRLYNTQLWRRVHSRAMIEYAKLAEREYDAAKNENREYDVKVPCRGLAEHLFGQDRIAEFAPLLEEGRKTYYKDLVDGYPQIFVESLPADRQEKAIERVRSDIDASQLGPDILIAKVIEQKHNRREAANYLHALLLGRVR